MGLFKSLKKLSLKKVAKTVAKVAPIALAVIPGVGPVVAAGIAIATKVSGALSAAKAKVEGIQDVINGPSPPLIGKPVLSTGPSAGAGAIAGFGGLPLILMIGALLYFLFGRKGRRR
jgi:hypothetical protein